MKDSALTPLKVLFITHAYPDHPGSFRGHLVHRMARGLRQRGVQVHVLTPRIYPHSPLRETDERGIRVYRFPYPSGNRMLLEFRRIPVLRMTIFAISCFLLGWKLLRRDRYHLIHGHWIVPLGPLAVVLGMLFRVPTILHAHGSDVHTYGKRSLPLRLLTRFAVKQARRVVAVSGSLATQLADACPSGRSRITVQPPFVDGDVFTPGGEPALPPTIVFAGGLHESKGILPLLGAAETFLTQRPELHLLFLGDGPLKEHILSWRSEHGFADRVTVAGAVPYGEMAARLGKTFALVLPSFQEGTPSIILEALACGVPCIASGVGDIPRVVRDGENGILVEPGSAEDIAAAVLRLCREPVLTASMRSKARGTVLPYLSGAGIDRLLELYRETADTRPRFSVPRKPVPERSERAVRFG